MANSSRRRDGGGAAALQQLLEGALAGLDMGVRVREHAALRAWPRVAGQVVEAHARAEAMRDGVLIVSTDSPAWAQELHMRQTDLLAGLASLLGEGVVREIHFRSGRRQCGGRPVLRQGTPREEALTPRQVEEVQAAAARIGDAVLRERAERAFASLERIRLWRRKKGWRQCTRCGQWQRTGKRWCASCTHRRGEGS